MIRITGGKFRGRGIESPPRSKDIRPTTSLIRESVFSRIQAELPGSRFLDLFAGSGIMGLEAISRGAAFVLAVEGDPAQCRQIRNHYARLGVGEEQAKVVVHDVLKLLAKSNRQAPFDLIFMDPPYGLKELPNVVQRYTDNGWLKPDGILIVEHGSRDPDLPGFDRRDYGDTSISFRYGFATSP